MMGWSRFPISPEKTIFRVSLPSVSHISTLAEPSRWPASTKRAFTPSAIWISESYSQVTMRFTASSASATV